MDTKQMKNTRKLRQALAILASLLIPALATLRYLQAAGMLGTLQDHWGLALGIFSATAVGMLCCTSALIASGWGQRKP